MLGRFFKALYFLTTGQMYVTLKNLPSPETPRKLTEHFTDVS